MRKFWKSTELPAFLSISEVSARGNTSACDHSRLYRRMVHFGRPGDHHSVGTLQSEAEMSAAEMLHVMFWEASGCLCADFGQAALAATLPMMAGPPARPIESSLKPLETARLKTEVAMCPGHCCFHESLMLHGHSAGAFTSVVAWERHNKDAYQGLEMAPYSYMGYDLWLF